VRARNINPVTHTRLPRYARRKPGTIERDHGVFVFADTSVYSLGEKPQHLYSVRFSARELWGEQAAPQDAVYLDLYDDYLEPAWCHRGGRARCRASPPPARRRRPLFAEPWEAQAVALAVKLSEQDHFTWREWAAALADELKAAADRGEHDDGSHYYHHWLATLERLVIAKGLADHAALETRKDAWAEAYRHTSHGTPVELAADAMCAKPP
jgi:nitrile hydratase accessory protein